MCSCQLSASFYRNIQHYWCRWLRKEKQRKLAERAAATDSSDAGRPVMVLPQWSNGYVSGRLTSSLKDSTNAVMRL